MLRQEIGLKPEPEQVDGAETEDDFGPAFSVKSMPTRPDSSKGFGKPNHNRSIASSKNAQGTPSSKHEPAQAK